MPQRFALLPIAFALCAATTAHAQTRDPWYVGASQTFTHRSNVYDEPGANETSDTISTTAVRGGVDLPFGRQRFHADASASHVRYADNKALNSTGYGLAAGLDWQTIERLSGSVTLNSYQTPTRLNPGGGLPVLTRRNLQRADDVAARVRLGVVTRLGVEAGVSHREVSYSAPEFAFAEFRRDQANLGVSYRFSGLLSTSIGVNTEEGRYPNFAPLPGVAVFGDQSTRREVYLTALWVPTGASTVNARLNIGKTEYDNAPVRNFSGATGTLSWTWIPTGKLRLVTRLARDSGQELSFPQVIDGDLSTGTDFSRVSTTVSLRAGYEVTAKIAMNAGVGHTRRELIDAAGNDASDRSTLWTVGATWAPTRTLTFGCNASRETRSRSSLSSDFRTNVFGCFGSILLS